jgi:hypothetical protein
MNIGSIVDLQTHQTVYLTVSINPVLVDIESITPILKLWMPIGLFGNGGVSQLQHGFGLKVDFKYTG